jgi:hypothetical protein
VHGMHKCASVNESQFMWNDWGQVNLGNVAKAGNPSMKQSKNSVLTCKIKYAMFKQVMIMLVGLFGQADFGALRTCTLHRQCLL